MIKEKEWEEMPMKSKDIINVLSKSVENPMDHKEASINTIN